MMDERTKRVLYCGVKSRNGKNTSGIVVSLMYTGGAYSRDGIRWVSQFPADW